MEDEKAWYGVWSYLATNQVNHQKLEEAREDSPLEPMLYLKLIINKDLV